MSSLFDKLALLAGNQDPSAPAQPQQQQPQQPQPQQPQPQPQPQPQQQQQQYYQEPQQQYYEEPQQQQYYEEPQQQQYYEEPQQQSYYPDDPPQEYYQEEPQQAEAAPMMSWDEWWAQPENQEMAQQLNVQPAQGEHTGMGFIPKQANYASAANFLKTAELERKPEGGIGLGGAIGLGAGGAALGGAGGAYSGVAGMMKNNPRAAEEVRNYLHNYKAVRQAKLDKAQKVKIRMRRLPHQKNIPISEVMKKQLPRQKKIYQMMAKGMKGSGLKGGLVGAGLGLGAAGLYNYLRD